MITRALQRFRVCLGARAKRTKIRVVSDEALRLLRLPGAVDDAVAAPSPRPQRPYVGLQMDEAEVASLIEAMRNEPMWCEMRQEPAHVDTAVTIDLHKLWRRIEALRSLRRV